MPFDKSKYDQEYARKNVIRKHIPFNKLKPEDMKLLEWIESREESATAYIKRLVLEDMEKAPE